MKKLITLALAALLAVSVFVGCDEKDTLNNEAITLTEAFAKVDEFKPMSEMDSTMVAKAGEYDISLAEYRYYYMTYASQFPMYYGFDWKDNADYVTEFNGYIEDALRMPGVVLKLCGENGLGLAANDIKDGAFASYDKLKENYGEDVDKTLEENFFATPNFMLKNEVVYTLYNKLNNHLFAEGGVHYEEIKKDTLDFYTANDYIRAKHVLIQFPEVAEGEELTDEKKAEAKAKAEEVLAKAKAGEDFDTLISEYNEDPGMESNPTGYYFGKGEMVEPFENAAYALADGEVSELVETEYGYHVIKKLPVDDADITTSAMFKELAFTKFDEIIMAEIEAMELVKAENFDELVKAVVEEGDAYAEDLKLQYEAMYGASAGEGSGEESTEVTE